jgi:mannose-6-phosphate isomerase-like protein (cupin superfamily)
VCGFGVLEDDKVELNVGDAFIVPAGTLHSLRTDGELHVTATLVPVVDERQPHKENDHSR